GAKELGFADVGALWRAGYDMPPDDFTVEVDRLWSQVKPLYDDLHCYVRGKLNEKYGDDVVPLDKPIRADLLGNMWAQSWGELYDFIAPADADTGIDLNRLLVEEKYDPIKIVKTGEAFFSSLGFEPLPETFWERSQIVKPEGREVICHASAWDLDARDDVRIKMCAVVGAEDFRTVHHELGHNYYQRAYKDLPNIFRGGANDGFHEAIGDTITLSITPEYLRQIGLIDTVPDASKDIGLLLQQALDGVAFLPFGLLIDKWRWEVFSGELKPEQYNTGWWALREQYQGVRPPNERAADAFDPGAKYHIPGNTPYMRYFLARILQYQFYKAACQQAGWEGPLHRCSFYGSKEVGARFNAMLEMGQSKPWQDALEAFTGERQMDGSAILAYYAPLSAWLKQQNAGKTCGW
ncbi:MAG TPA: M2 family metallopeptidase, partial [Gammaproteobacteria bacterium]